MICGRQVSITPNGLGNVWLRMPSWLEPNPGHSHELVPVGPVRRRAAGASLQRFKNRFISKASFAERRYASARFCARMDSAFPFRVSLQSRQIRLALRVMSQKQTTASENAHFRWALPILLPEVPYTLPVDSFSISPDVVGSEIWTQEPPDIVDLVRTRDGFCRLEACPSR
jgi:hypothetical protein